MNACKDATRFDSDAPALPRTRMVVYVLLLTTIAGAFCFYRLSEGTLLGDEAAFAFTTDRMRATGDWVVPYIADQPHLNATPLYNWLTLALAPWCDDTPLLHRFWSAAFGVGCVLLTFALGTLLFRAEVGFLAGLLLAVNRSFLFDHASRFGGMDAMLAFFVGAAVFCYAWLLTRNVGGRRAFAAWSAVGVCLGLACLTKPPVFGCYFLFLIAVHWLVFAGRRSFVERVAGPLVAAAAAAIVAAPWYVLLWSRVGDAALHALFVHNSVERALDPTSRDYLYCQRAIWHASTTFKCSELAVAAALGCWFVNHRRMQWGLLVFVAGGYLLALSAAGKAGNYVFYVFPLLAVLLAGLFLESGPRLLAVIGPRGARGAAIVGIVSVIVLLGIDCSRIVRVLRGPSWVHPPVAFYDRLAPELAQRQCRLVLVDYARSDGSTPSGGRASNFEDLYYCDRMPLADRVRDEMELTRLLEDGTPAVVLLPPLTMPQPQLATLLPDLRVAENPWPGYVYPVLTFHGAADRFSYAELVWLARGSQ